MRRIIMIIPIMTFLMYAAIWLNIPILRDIIVFIYLSFVPGFVLLRIIKLDETNLVDTILFSAGLSITLSMFIGLTIDELYLVGVSQPLSTIPLTCALSFLTMILFSVCYRQHLLEDFSAWGIHWNGTKKLISKSATLVLPPVLGVVGALFLNIPILLLMIIVIAILYALSMLSTRLIPHELYPLLIFAISLALLFHVVFTSRYIIGFDSNLEYYVFKLTQINGHWSFLNAATNPVVTVNYNSMLSITILPTVYASMSNISGETLFQILYSFVFSLVPVTLYRIYERQIGRLASLASVFFFISGILVFYGVGPISLNRQIVGEFFFVLSIFTLLSKKISINKRRLLLTIFGAGLVVSHYSLMYIYLVFVLLIYAVAKIKGDSDAVLNSPMVVSLFCMAFLWYGFSVSALTSMAQFLLDFFSKFSIDMLNPAARSTHTYVSQPVSNAINSISLGVFFVAHFFIAIGILSIIFKTQKAGLDPKYRTITILSAIVMSLSFLLPNFAPSLNLDRFYAISLLFLAPCLFLGFKTLLDLTRSVWWRAAGRHLSENRSARIGISLLCIILVCFLLTQSGFVNRVAGNTPLLRSLDLDRLKTSIDLKVEISFYGSYLPDQDVFGAVWLHKHTGAASMVFADLYSMSHVLISYGMIPYQFVNLLDNMTILGQGSFVYLRRINVVNGVIPTGTELLNSSETLPIFARTDLLYSNGNSEILYTPSPG
jgi:uncharacterized membrane protein